MSWLETIVNDDRFQNHSLEDINFDDYDTDEPETWTFVRARRMRRGGVMYTEGIFKVISAHNKHRMLVDETKHYNQDDLEDEVDRYGVRSDVVPSLRGEYITVNRVYSNQMEDGTVVIDDHKDADTIPVEFVVEPMTYDEVIVEFIDEY